MEVVIFCTVSAIVWLLLGAIPRYTEAPAVVHDREAGLIWVEENGEWEVLAPESTLRKTCWPFKTVVFNTLKYTPPTSIYRPLGVGDRLLGATIVSMTELTVTFDRPVALESNLDESSI